MKHLTIPVLTPEIIARFWSRVDRSGDCWTWTGGVFDDGYGSFWIGGGRHNGGHSYRAPRIAYAIEHDDPGDLKVCHECDNPLCCRPEHLWLGTSQDNTDDMVAKSRKPVGTQVSNSKLTGDLATEIRESLEPDREIAGRLNIDQALVSKVRRCESWAHVPETAKGKLSREQRLQAGGTIRARGSDHHGAKLTEQDVREIRVSDTSHSEEARRRGVDRTLISLIRHRKIWTHVL